MQTTKRWFLDAAFDEIGLSSYVFNLSGDDMVSALRKLDTLVAMWEGQGLTVSWVFPANYDNSDPDDEVTVPDAALQALITNLALRIAPSFGKQVSIETRQAALQGLNALRTAKAVIPQQQYPSSMPLGQGNRTLYEQYFVAQDSITAQGEELNA